MDGKCAMLSDFNQVDLTKNSVKSKRKSNCMKIGFCCENIRSHKKKKLSVDDVHLNLPLLCPNNCNSKNNFEMSDLKSKATLLKYIKPCSVNLIPLDPIIYAFYNSHATHNSSSKFLQWNDERIFKDDNKDHLRSLKSTGNSVRSAEEKQATSDRMKTFKSCSVILKKIDLSDFAQDLKVKFPPSHFSADGIELKPCSVILHQLNVKETKISMSNTLNALKPGVDKPKNIATNVISVLNNCNDNILEDMNVIDSEEIFPFVRSSDCKNIGSSVTLSEEVLSTRSSCGEVCPSKIEATKAYVQHVNVSMESSSQNSKKSLSLNCSRVKSHSSAACDILLSNFDSLRNEKLPETVKLVEGSEFTKGKYLEYDSNSAYTGGKLQFALSPFNPSCGSETNFEKAESLKSSMMLKTNTVSSFVTLKSNEPSSFKLAVKSCSKSYRDKGVQCQKNTSENSMHYCFQCGKALPSLKSFYYHLCLGKHKRGYPCKFCEKNFDFYHSLQKHKKCHVLKNSLSCSDTMKSRHRNKTTGKTNCVLEIEKKTAIKALNSGKDVKKVPKGKENNNSPKLGQKKYKTKFFLQNKWDATTSSGRYSSDSDFLPYICNPDDSEVD